MKAVLVLDEMPHSCSCPECPLKALNAETDDDICSWNMEKIYPDERPEWCPLKKTPENKKYNDKNMFDYHRGYVDGWNNCLDDICGTEEKANEGDY